MPNVYEYLNYQNFLQDFYKEQKSNRYYFSFRYMAQKLEMDPAHIARILQGKRHISERCIDKFVELCKFDEQQRKYFTALVAFNKAKTDRESKERFERLISATEIPSRILQADEYQFYQKWYYTAVRSLIAVGTFKAKGDFSRIASELSPPISAKEAKEAVSLLMKLGLVTDNQEGNLILTDKNISTGAHWRSVAVRTFQKQTMKLAAEALERIPREVRDISTITLGVSLKNLPLLKDRIQEFRSSLTRLANEDTMPDEVYQLNIQLFPLSNRTRGKS